MQRRLLICALACCPVAAMATAPESGQPRHKISAATLHQALYEHFPLRLALGGLVALEVSAPRLHLVPVRNQLGAALQARAGGPALQPLPPGELDLVFGVRYEAADRTLRAYRPEILGLRLPGLAPEAAGALQQLLPAAAREVLGDIVLHRFSPRELALADTMGFEPDRVTVVDDGLVLAFAPKTSPAPAAQ